MKQRRSLLDLILNIIIVFFAVLSFFPLYWLLASSFKFSHDIIKIPPMWYPENFTLQNYYNLFSQSNTWKWLINSLIVAGATTVLIVLVSTLAAYAFAKLNFFGKNVLFIVFISTLMLPKEVYIVPLFKVTQYMGISGGFAGTILPNVAMSLGIFLLKQYFEGIPNALREAAKVDGAHELTIFIRIYLPTVTAGIAALSVLMFVQTWNDYLWQLIQLTKDELKTIQLGVAGLQSEHHPDYGLIMAGAVYAALPLSIIFMLFQKYFTQGITMGAVKE